MNIKITCVYVLLSLFSLQAFAGLSDFDYYRDHLAEIQKNKDHKLIDSLHVAIKDQQVFGYKTARRLMFGSIYLEQDGSNYYIEDVYCEQKFNHTSGVGPGRIPNHQKINCEHTWPQSRFNRNYSSSAQKSDLHHLFPSNSRANSARGNSPFAEVHGSPLGGCSASSRGSNIYNGTSSFEPPNSHKGNVARALFYFSVRYKTPLSDDQEVHLRKWNRLDPVDQKERMRHEKVYGHQGNRNPFIDDEGLIDQIADL